MQYDLVVRNGQLATATDLVTCDIGIRGGKVACLAERLPQGDREIDAAGKYVIPGGVDAHCHLDQPMGDGSRMADDFETGTLSAACGGTTTVIPFACQIRGRSLREAVDDYHRRAQGKAVVDYAFHLIVSDPTEQVWQELPALIREGYTSFKIYMTYDDLKLSDREILETLSLARREGALCMIHAENADCIGWLTDRLLMDGKTAPAFHAASRPSAVEREATHRAISLAELVDTPILIVHVSGREAIEQIRWARARGLRIYAETCPQYLFLSAEDLGAPGFEGAKCICSPPPRDRANQAAVWNALVEGLFTIFSSDHAPFRFDDAKGKKLDGDKAAFNKVPNGIPGLETRLPLLLSEGFGRGRLSLQKVVALTASAPAKLYGLYPRKGTIAVGSDADLAIWNPDREVAVSNAMLHHNVDYTPYEGMALRGAIETTVARGEVIWHNGAVTAAKGRGIFLPCSRPAAARPDGDLDGPAPD